MQPGRPAQVGKGCAAFVAVAVLLSGLGAAVGEPIQFSDPSKVPSGPKRPSVRLPSGEQPSELRKPGATESLQLPFMPQDEKMDPTKSRRYREALERRKYWIFLKPEDLHRSGSAEEVFGVETRDASKGNSKGPSVVQRFFESDNKKPSNSRKSNGEKNDAEFDDETSVDEEIEIDARRDSEKQQSGLNWDNLFKDEASANRPFGSRGNRDVFGGLFPALDFGSLPAPQKVRGGNDKSWTEQARENRAVEFEKLLGQQPLKSVIPNEKELLNAVTDTTQQPLNPTGSLREDQFGFARDGAGPFSSLDSPGALGARNAGPGFGEELATRIFGPSTFSGPVLANPSAPPPVPRPGAFELPRRKF